MTDRPTSYAPKFWGAPPYKSMPVMIWLRVMVVCTTKSSAGRNHLVPGHSFPRRIEDLGGLDLANRHCFMIYLTKETSLTMQPVFLLNWTRLFL
jgi:hypothetical protein